MTGCCHVDGIDTAQVRNSVAPLRPIIVSQARP